MNEARADDLSPMEEAKYRYRQAYRSTDNLLGHMIKKLKRKKNI